MDTKCPHRYPSAEIMSRPDLLDAYLPESFPVLTEKKPQVSGTTFCCVETIILASIQGGRLGKILPAAPILQHHTKGIPNVPQKWVEQVLSARNRPSPALRHDDTNATGIYAGKVQNGQTTQAVTPPCRCRPAPTRQKDVWDHSMPPRPTCACRFRLLLATRLFQISPGQTGTESISMPSCPLLVRPGCNNLWQDVC